MPMGVAAGEGLEPPTGSFRDVVRAMLRRRPDVPERAIAVGDLVAALAPLVVLGAGLGGIVVAVTSDVDPLLPMVLVMWQPFAWAHLRGARHRWLALTAACVAAWVVTVALVGLLPDGDWPTVVAVALGTMAASAPYALVTRITR